MMTKQLKAYSTHLEDLLNTVYKLYENTKFFIAGAIGASIVAYYLIDRINNQQNIKPRPRFQEKD